jgi:hypothetical protein
MRNEPRLGLLFCRVVASDEHLVREPRG